MFLPANSNSGRHENFGAVSGSSIGTTVTASATANTKGSWATLIASTGFTYEGFTLFAINPSNTAAYLLDIGIDDGSGNVNVIVQDLYVVCLKSANEHNGAYLIPVHVPAGSKLVCRIQATVGSRALRVSGIGHSQNIGGAPGYSRMVPLTTYSSGVGPTIDAGGTANTKGSYVTVISSTPEEVAAITIVLGQAGDIDKTADDDFLIDFAIGASSSEQIFLGDLYYSHDLGTDGPYDNIYGPIPQVIAAGSRIAVRAQCGVSTAGDRTFDVGISGFVR